MVFAYYRAITELGISADIVPYDKDLTDYRFVIAPLMFIGDPTVIDRLEAYVARGGTLLLGTRSGSKNRITSYNVCYTKLLRSVVVGINS